MTKTAMTLPTRLRRTRKSRGLTQAEAADELGLSRGYLARVERGEETLSSASEAWIRHWCECPRCEEPARFHVSLRGREEE